MRRNFPGLTDTPAAKFPQPALLSKLYLKTRPNLRKKKCLALDSGCYAWVGLSYTAKEKTFWIPKGKSRERWTLLVDRCKGLWSHRIIEVTRFLREILALLWKEIAVSWNTGFKKRERGIGTDSSVKCSSTKKKKYHLIFLGKLLKLISKAEFPISNIDKSIGQNTRNFTSSVVCVGYHIFPTMFYL